MKKLFIALFTVFSFSSFATHYLGGTISWEKLNNGQFVFELRIYLECGTGASVYASTIIHGPQGNIPTNLDTVLPYMPECTGTPISCGSVTAGQGAVQVIVLKSAPVTLVGAPPASGWRFYWADSARPTTVVNTNEPTLFLESRMYDLNAPASPSFAEQKLDVIDSNTTTYDVGAKKGSQDDSLHYKLVPYKRNGNPGVYTFNYSGVSPFPSNLTNAANGPVSIDPTTGLISLDAKVGTPGLYVVRAEVEQWIGGSLSSVIGMEYSVLYKTNTAMNNPPIVEIDTNLYSGIAQVGPYAYKAKVNIGDTLEFEMIGIDNDTNSSNALLQQIDFDASGAALSSTWGGANYYVETPLLAPVSPQLGFAVTDTNRISFKWVVKDEHCDVYKKTHHFTFTFKDDECPHPARTNITLEVEVLREISLSTDSLKLCSGDSVQLQGWTNNGSYSWSPIAGLSDDTISNPMASPSASGYYYLSNGNGAVDSVYVQVKQQGTIDLAFANGRLELTDTNGTSNRIWYYNGIPFFYPYDTLTPFGYGDYWVKAQDGPCALFSNVYNINLGHSFSVFDPNNGGYNGTHLPVPGSMGATFSINQNATINSVTIVGLEDLHKSSTGYDLNLKVYDANQVEVFSKDVTLTPPFFGPLHIEIGYAISANADYTVAVSGDTAYSFKMFENVSYPATPHNNGITVKGAYEGAAGQFPTQPSNYLLPFTINTDVQVVSVSEHPAGAFEIYPNPATSGITIGGLKGESEILLLDLNGKLIAKIITAEKSVAIKSGNIPAGIYFVKITDSNTTALQKVLFK